MAENSSSEFCGSKLFKSLGKGDLVEVMKAYDEATRPTDKRLNLIITVHKDTILHMAIYMRQWKIAIEIIQRCSDGDELLTKANEFGNTALHEAAATDDDSSLVKKLLEKAPTLLSKPNKRGEMPLYTAAYYGHRKNYKFLEEEVKKSHSNDLLKHLCSFDGTVLHATVHAEFYELAYEIATSESFEPLLNQPDKDSKICLHLLASNPSAFKSGNNWGPIKRFLYYCAPSENSVLDTNDSISGDETRASFSFKLKVPLEIQMCYIRCTSTLRQAISSANRFAWKILRAWSTMESIYQLKKSRGFASKLASLLIQEDYSWDSMRSGGIMIKTAQGNQPLGLSDSKKAQGDQPLGLSDSFDASGEGTSTGDVPPPTADSTPIPLFIATSHGILEVVKEILRRNAQALEYRDESNDQNILHVAIMHRQLQIFDLVQKNKAPNSRLVRQIDNNGYTILHQVGNMKFYNGGTRPGPALQLQEELEWFEKVKKIVPQHYPTKRVCTKEEIETPQQNAYSAKVHEKCMIGETPKEYFRRTHGQLLKDAQDWLKTTSESCSTVAGLMATVAFAAAFTVPGGNDDKNGQPILIHNPFFLVFVITDALSLASSLTSLVMFLSILTSPFEIEDFLVSLPRKLILGFTFLFFSVAVSMLAFASTLMLTIPIKNQLTTTFVYCVAFLPVTMFALLQWPLYRAFETSVNYSFAAIRSLLHGFSSPLLKLTKVTKAHTP